MRRPHRGACALLYIVRRVFVSNLRLARVRQQTALLTPPRGNDHHLWFFSGDRLQQWYRVSRDERLAENA